MKKIIMMFSLLLFLILVGCQSKKETLNQLESEVRKYDQYAVLVNYKKGFEDNDQRRALKVVAAHDGTELYYIFQIRSLFIDDAFKLFVDQVEFKKLITSGHLKEDLLIINAKDIPDGNTLNIYYGWGYGKKDYNKDIKLVKSIYEIDQLNVQFKDASDFQDKDIISSYEFANDHYIKNMTITMFILYIIIILITFEIYKQIYKKHIERKLSDENYKRKLPDLQQFKIIFITLFTIISIGIYLILGFSYENKRSKYTYVEGTSLVETVSGVNEELSMRISVPYSDTDYQTIIFEKPVGGGLDYEYEITFDNVNKSIIRMGSSGALIYKDVFEFVNYDIMEIRVYDLMSDYEEVYYRKIDLRNWKY